VRIVCSGGQYTPCTSVNFEIAFPIRKMFLTASMLFECPSSKFYNNSVRICYPESFSRKAEVTGSNPVGCANGFNELDLFLHCQKSACPQYVLRIRSRAVPGIGGKCSVTQGPDSPCDASVTIKGENQGRRKPESISECQ
jgi:hypothetical protein